MGAVDKKYVFYLSWSLLIEHDLVFFAVSSLYRQLALTETPTTRDLTNQLLYPFVHAHGVTNEFLGYLSHVLCGTMHMRCTA